MYCCLRDKAACIITQSFKNGKDPIVPLRPEGIISLTSVPGKITLCLDYYALSLLYNYNGGRHHDPEHQAASRPLPLRARPRAAHQACGVRVRRAGALRAVHGGLRPQRPPHRDLRHQYLQSARHGPCAGGSGDRAGGQGPAQRKGPDRGLHDPLREDAGLCGRGRRRHPDGLRPLQRLASGHPLRGPSSSTGRRSPSPCRRRTR